MDATSNYLRCVCIYEINYKTPIDCNGARISCIVYIISTVFPDDNPHSYASRSRLSYM